MAGTKNDVLVAKNADYSQAAAPNPQSSENNGLITNGQMWIGTTALNSGGTHINVGKITSPSGTVSIGYTSPNITLDAGGAVATTYTENSGTATPAAGNLNVLGPNTALTGYSPWTVGSGSTITANMPGTVKWVVNSVANLGTHTTIQAAITAASSGDDVFITPGTYTENLTLKAGVNLLAYTTDGTTPSVTIIGKATMTTAGTVSISGIRLQTNADFFLAVTGSAASIVYLNNCYLNCANATGISFTSSSGSALISINYCFVIIAGANAFYTATSAGNLTIAFSDCDITGTSGTATASSTSATVVRIKNSMIGFPLSTTSTGQIQAWNSYFDNIVANVTSVTLAGTGSASFTGCGFTSGTASALSVGTGTTLNLQACSVVSSNTNAITGAGTVNYSAVSYGQGASSGINVTSQVNASPYMTKIATLTASNSASLAFTSTHITAAYTAYYIVYNNIIAGTASQTLNMDWSVNNGGAYLNSNYNNACLVGSWNSATLSNPGYTTTCPISAPTNSSTTIPTSGNLTIYAVGTSQHTNYTGSFMCSGNVYGMIFGGQAGALITLNNIKFSFSSGNIASGTITLYGIVQ